MSKSRSAMRPSTAFLVLVLGSVVYLTIWPSTIIFPTQAFPVFATAFLMVALAIAGWANRRNAKRLERIVESTDALMQGDYSLVLEEDGGDSIAGVSAAINRLGEHVHRSIDQLRTGEQRIRKLAYMDALTGLPNRRMFEYLLDRELALARRGGHCLAIAFLDVDNLKDANDSLGHHYGDLLLKEIARRLKSELRASDILARVAGDEFALVIRCSAQNVESVSPLQRILEVCRQPYEFDSKEVLTSVSIGVCFFPEDGQAPRLLMRNADFALYSAKEEGRNRIRVLSGSMSRRADERLRLEGDLRRAIKREEFLLEWQPQVALDDGRIVGVEALVRWQHPHQGQIMPDAFISLIEETGLMPALGYQVLFDACSEAVHWQTMGCSETPVSVNVSVRQLQTGDFVEEVKQLLEATGLEPSLLKLEITESVAVEGESIMRQLSNLHDFGVGLAIDDFGTGYSSFNYILKHRIDTLKIDKSFVQQIGHHHESSVLIQAILSMARNLQLNVVAEGVETQQQLEILHHWGCEIGQGFLFMKPVSAEAIEPVLREGRIPIVRLPHLVAEPVPS